MLSKSARTSYPGAVLALATVLVLLDEGCAMVAGPSTPATATVPPAPSASALPAVSGPLSPWTKAPPSETLVPVGPAAPFVSAGHGRDRFTARLRASDGAAFGGPEPRAAGFVVCASHDERGTAGASKSVFCMRKESARPGDWTYGVAEGYEAAFQRVGRLADCSACHAVGPREGLFDAGARP